MKRMLCVLLLVCTAFHGVALGQGTVTGELKKWHRVTVDFHGPAMAEGQSSPNPFLDFRLQVNFTGPDGKVQSVPGFFDGDGKGNGQGNVWRVHFAPDQPGKWKYVASFRTGENVAVDLDAAAGTASGFDGASGEFTVGDRDPNAPGFLSQGRLEYVGGHYLKFRDGSYWLKGGADSPENVLGYRGFDNTKRGKLGYALHVPDWREGDPDWDSPDAEGEHDGRAIIGAINYLASEHVNSIDLQPMNIGGDARDTSPFTNIQFWAGNVKNDNLHYDISMLTQWEIFFAHTERKGVALHFVLNEAEVANKKELDDATLGVERKLFYRELIARFGHHNALQWNISEEYNLGLELPAGEFSDYIGAVDPYKHPRTVHQYKNDLTLSWHKLVEEKHWELTSIQLGGKYDGLGVVIEDMRERSAKAGRPLPIMIDEPGSVSIIPGGLENVRKRMTWDIYLSGGSVEWYASKQDQTLDDFRPLEQLWRETWYARKFLEQNTRFWEMKPDDGLLRNEDSAFGGAEVFAIAGEQYAIYLPDTSNDNAKGTPELNLTGYENKQFQLRWYNPRTGEFAGEPVILKEGSWRSIGPSPDGLGNANDWAALVTVIKN